MPVTIRGFWMLALLCMFTAQAQAQAVLRAYPQAVQLDHAADVQSIVVQMMHEDGITRDLTMDAGYTVADPDIAIFKDHQLQPKSDGKTELRITAAGQLIVIPVTVTNSGVTQPISFKLDVMPVFMRAGCNTGACHGAARGKDGFHLSLFGYDPDGDYYRLTQEMPGRRVNHALPEESLLITKSLGTALHTGGKRFEPDSDYYQTFMRWIEAGTPKDSEDVAQPIALRIMPDDLVLAGRGSTQQMSVLATYSDGTDRDVTHLTVFMSNNDNTAAIDEDGVVTAGERGEAFVMARFATFTVGSHAIVIPADAPPGIRDAAENNYIDTLINDKLRRMRITPSQVAGDEVFLRRVYLDIIGQLPTREEYEAFLASTDPDKRAKLIDELLERKEFVEIWVMKWAELLKIRSDENQGVSYKSALLYYKWLEDRIGRNVPFNEIVEELLSASGGTFANPPTNYFQIQQDKLLIAEDTAQVFMGMRLQCAQCHNHPFDRWTMEDYYGFAAFFEKVGRKRAEDPRERIVFDRGGGNETRHPLTNEPVTARYLGGDVPDIRGQSRRQVLAQWLTSDENPYFARNLANVTWSHFFGRGIIEPVDDVRISNPPSNAALLDELAKRLTEYNYDFKQLVRDICNSRAYQRSTQGNDTNRLDDSNFSKAPIRRIRAEILLDSITQVTETKNKFQGLPLGARAVQIADGRASNYFLTTFGRAKRETVCSCEVVMEPNLSQALHLINGDTVHGKVRNGGVIKRMLEKGHSPELIIENLYVRCLTRKPTNRELEALVPMVEQAENRREVLEDIFWSLLNSKEFIFNH